MAEARRDDADQAFMREMGLTDERVEQRRRAAALEPDDVRRVATLQPIVTANLDAYVATFFDFLARFDEARTLLSNAAAVAKARTLKRQHLQAMVAGEYGAAYAGERVRLGLLYARAGLEVRFFLGAFQQLLHRIGVDVLRAAPNGPSEAFEAYQSLLKLAFFDVGLIVDALIFARERTIGQQQEAIRELSTPVLQIRDRLLLLPIIGVIDTHRARLITENLLRSIRAARAKAVVMDVTGVATIDSRVANHLMQTVTAARLMGARVIVTGVSSEVAQSLVALGIELARLNTVGDLQGGLEEAERMIARRGPMPEPDDEDDVELDGRA